VFIQGDHFQVNVKKFAVDPVTEVDAVKQLVREAVRRLLQHRRGHEHAGGSVAAHARRTAASQLRAVRGDHARRARRRAQGVTISVGGEIGEVGTENSTPEELEAFMEGFNRTLEAQAPGTAGLSKISVQSGTSHGGIVLADGSIAEVALDLDTLAKC
jgi:fructose-bisphosphate aldolase, class II